MMVIKVIAVLCVIATSIYFALRDAAVTLPSSWQFLTIDTKGNLKISNRRGQIFKPELADNCFISKQLIILNFQRKGLRLVMPPVISFTNLENTDDLRRLRVWLRWGKPSARRKKTQS